MYYLQHPYESRRPRLAELSVVVHTVDVVRAKLERLPREDLNSDI